MFVLDGEVERGATFAVGFTEIELCAGEDGEGGEIAVTSSFVDAFGSGGDVEFFEFAEGDLRSIKVSILMEDTEGAGSENKQHCD